MLHARDERGDAIVIIEAKSRGGQLKRNAKLPDSEPGSYLDRSDFLFTDRRFLLYPVDATDAERVASMGTLAPRFARP